MAGRHPFAKLREGMSPAAQAQITTRAASLREEVDLAGLRRTRRLGREKFKQVLETDRGAIAKVEL